VGHECASIIPLTGNIDVFSLKGPPAYYTPIGLGPLGGHPAYKPLTREGTHQITQRGRPSDWRIAYLYVVLGVEKSRLGDVTPNGNRGNRAPA
jgi:hypothetical protein